MIVALGHALAEMDSRTGKDPAVLAAIDQVKARNRRERMDQAIPSPNDGTPDTPNLRESSGRIGPGRRAGPI
jgi:hypothetical protein